MRLRNKNWTTEYLNQHQAMMLNFTDHQLDLANSFLNETSNYALEIGCGKGQFILNQALTHPDTNFIGMEKEQTVVGVALRKAVEETTKTLPNLKFLNAYAENLLAIFSPQSFDVIYLNFSDPWPKTKHFKKRLTYSTFLDQYAVLLRDHGTIEIKTDNDQLYDFSLEEVSNHPRFKIIAKTTNLYANEAMLSGNIATEYETKFHQLGKNINKIILEKVL